MTRPRRYFKNDEDNADINYLMNLDYFLTASLPNDVLMIALHSMLADNKHFQGEVKLSQQPNDCSVLAFYSEDDYRDFKNVLNAMEDNQ